MTSNIGSEYILDGEDYKVMDALKSTFKPEFINRIDEVIIFKKLDKKVLYEVLDKIIFEIESRLKDKNLKIKLTSAAKDYLIDNGYDSAYGARPLKRMVTSTIENLLARKIINGEVKFGEEVTFDVKNNQIEID
jgi:ATP-dependent Clp protease ATP-binding subunit ClpB